MNWHIPVARFISHQNHQPMANLVPSSPFLLFPFHFIAKPRHHPIISYIYNIYIIYILGLIII